MTVNVSIRRFFFLSLKPLLFKIKQYVNLFPYQKQFVDYIAVRCFYKEKYSKGISFLLKIYHEVWAIFIYIYKCFFFTTGRWQYVRRYFLDLR